MKDIYPYLFAGNKDVVYRLRRRAKGDKIRGSQENTVVKQRWNSQDSVLHWKKTHVWIFVYVHL